MEFMINQFLSREYQEYLKCRIKQFFSEGQLSGDDTRETESFEKRIQEAEPELKAFFEKHLSRKTTKLSDITMAVHNQDVICPPGLKKSVCLPAHLKTFPKIGGDSDGTAKALQTATLNLFNYSSLLFDKLYATQQGHPYHCL
jgi:hypothetical protein